MPPSRPDLENKVLRDYFELFLNRRAYTLQTIGGEGKEKKSHYYRPKDDRYASLETIRRHLLGEITVGLYALNPVTQRCKWIVIDADYHDALTDLLRLQWELRNDGVESALEKSRRGGHLWIFTQEPLLAAECRRYVQSLAARVRTAVSGAAERQKLAQTSIEGIEIFPKQDRLSAGQFGNAIRAPLGVHRRDGKRYWFYGASYEIEAQLEYLQGLGKFSQEKLTRFLAAAPSTSEEQSVAAQHTGKRTSFTPGGSLPGQFSILNYVSGRLRKMGRNYFTRCPACARHGRDKHGDNLAISVNEPTKYRCWAGCTKEEIRAAVGLCVSQMYCAKS